MSELHRRAVQLLARREHSRAELERKLAPHGAREEINLVLDELAAAGLQSDRRFAEAWLRSHCERFGAARLRRELRDKGLAAELIENSMDELGDDEEARAHDVWRRKFAVAPADARAWAKQARFLQGRGFDGDTIRKVLKRQSP